MRVELPCEIVRDLLPTYIDGLANETTAASVEAHMEGCENCRRMYEDMTGPEPETMPVDAPAVDFLKRVRSKAMQNLIFCTTSAIAIVLIVGYIWFFVVGFVTPASMVDVRLEQTAEGFAISGTILDDHRCVGSEVEEEMDGVLDIRLYNTYRIFRKNTSFQFPVVPTGDIHRITLNGTDILWDDGVFITSGVSRMYAAKTPYVGDASAVNRVVQAIGLSDVLRACGMELHTENAPYGITFLPGETMTAEEYKEYQRILPAYGILMLAEIDNLDYVQFDLDVEGKTKRIQVDAEWAASTTGQSARYWGASPANLQELVKQLQMFGEPVFAPQADLLTSDNFELGSVIETDDDIYHIGLALVVNGEIQEGGIMGHGNGDPLKGRAFGVGFTPELEGYRVDMAKDHVEVKITLYGERDDLSDILGEVYVELDPDDPLYYDGNTYTRDITITGSQAAGYHGE